MFALLIGISASLKIFNNKSVIISMKKYDTDTSLSFSSHTNISTATGFVNLITKYSKCVFLNLTKF